MTVLAFKPREREPETENTFAHGATDKIKIVSGEEHEERGSRHRLSVNDLYPESDLVPSASVEARKMLGNVLQYLNKANASANESDVIAADDALNHAIATCAKAFHFQHLGEGFGMVVNGALSALENTVGRPFHVKQTVAIKGLLETLIREPYLTTEAASQLLEDAEVSGISTEPAGTAVLLDWVIG